jgi:hypothetical protein
MSEPGASRDLALVISGWATDPFVGDRHRLAEQTFASFVRPVEASYGSSE